MTVPKVIITELNGALGILPASAGKILAVVGPCGSGPFNTPATFGRSTDIESNFTDGAAAEAAATHVDRTGSPVCLVRTETTTDGAATAVDLDLVDGTSVITCDVSTEQPHDDYEVAFEVLSGGTIGTGPISFRWSLDGGRNWSRATALGTVNTFTIPDSGVVLDFAAGTLVTGDLATFRTSGPKWTAAELGAALDALALSSLNIGIIEIVGAIDATAFDMIATKIATMRGRGKRRAWMGNTRVKNVGESEAAFLTAMDAIFSEKSNEFGALCYDGEEIVSPFSGRQYLRPIVFGCASREAASSPEVNQADVNLGSRLGNITDANGNPKHHDEALYPGADDARFYSLRTHNNLSGSYVNRPKLFSAQGSDFDIMPHRRVMDIAEDVLEAYFTRRLNSPIQVNAETGRILESEALEIEAGAEAALEAALMARPMASGITVVVSRLDNLLSTKTLTGDARIVPLAYPEIVDLKVGFSNPALFLQAA